MLRFFPRLSRVIFSGPAIRTAMPHIGHTIDTAWHSLFDDSLPRRAHQVAVALVQVDAPSAVTTVALDETDNFRRRMQDLNLADDAH